MSENQSPYALRPTEEPLRQSLAHEEAEHLRELSELVETMRSRVSWPEDPTDVVCTLPEPPEGLRHWLEEMADWIERQHAPVQDLRRWLVARHVYAPSRWEARDYKPWEGFIPCGEDQGV